MEILTGDSDTKQHAPLSQAQTVAMCKHLHRLHEESCKQIQDLRTLLAGTDSRLDGESKKVAGLEAEMRKVKHELFGTDGLAQRLAREVGKCQAFEKQLQADIEHNAKDTDQLRMGQATTNNNVASVKAELAKRTGELRKVRQDVDLLLEVKSPDWESHISTLQIKVENLKAAHEGTMTGLGVAQKRIKELTDDAKVAAGNVKDLQRRADKSEATAEQETLRLDGAVENLEMTNGVVKTLHKAFENQDVRLDSLHGDVRGLNGNLNHLNEEHKSTATSLKVTREDLSRLGASHESTRKSLNTTIEKVSTLSDKHKHLSSSLSGVTRGLERVDVLANTTQQDLQATNAFVLPNLSAEGAVPHTGHPAAVDASVESRYGGRHNKEAKDWREQGNAPLSARKKKESWHVKNIGLVPDRMSWI